ncbi:hypothetical protein WMZ97_00740 [Lentibacillus sp. N15]|uniref:hypothetical protein n=1 Tax=Lentibacillus songyuanensis TaxID=3136161 RepID=UPI0031BA4AFF
MKKSNAVIFGSLILGIILGIFGQDFAYLLHENFTKLDPIYNLTVLTLVSIFLFLNSLVLTYIQYKKQKIEKDKFGAYISVFFIVGLLTSCWSLFVLFMWWG